MEYETYISIFSTKLSETLLILGRTKRDMINNVYWSSCIVPVTHVRLSLILNILERFAKSNQISNFTKIRPVGVELFYTYRRTGRQTYIHDKAKSRF
jgi:hypothetical protein